ncbi:MAG: DUF3224 domain-containing protein [Ignavibacteriales bacterium]|nr:MAG: DUF3224 domain-containing protein [Ignavibacteriales bacterium]
MKAQSTYTVKKWEENIYDQISPEQGMSKASIEFEITGDLSGKATVEYLMFYKSIDPNDQHNSSAVYTGLMRFAGKLNDRKGSFVMEDHGTFEKGTAGSSLQIISGSGTDELKNIQGTGNYIANRDGFRLELDYEI